MHGEPETSMLPRTMGVVLHFALTIGADWLYFGGRIAAVGQWLGLDWRPGNSLRCLLLFSFGVILWLRLTLTTFCL